LHGTRLMIYPSQKQRRRHEVSDNSSWLLLNDGGRVAVGYGDDLPTRDRPESPYLSPE
jgi:hypothetical protein